jgi:hypothetical protein
MTKELTGEEQFWMVVAISQLPNEVKEQLQGLFQLKYDEGFSDGYKHCLDGKDVTTKELEEESRKLPYNLDIKE